MNKKQYKKYKLLTSEKKEEFDKTLKLEINYSANSTILYATILYCITSLSYIILYLNILEPEKFVFSKEELITFFIGINNIGKILIFISLLFIIINIIQTIYINYKRFKFLKKNTKVDYEVKNEKDY